MDSFGNFIFDVFFFSLLSCRGVVKATFETG